MSVLATFLAKSDVVGFQHTARVKATPLRIFSDYFLKFSVELFLYSTIEQPLVPYSSFPRKNLA